MKRANRSKLFLSWILSYLFILIMPLTISYFVYYRANKTIDQEIASVNSISLHQLLSVIDSGFTSFERIVGNLSLNSDVRMLLAGTGGNEGRQIKNILRVQDALSRHQLTDNLIDEIYLYINDQQIMVTGTHKYNTDGLDQVCVKKLGLTSDEMMTLAAQRHPAAFRIAGNNSDGQQKKLLYMNPLYAYSLSRPAGLLIIRLSDTEFSRMLRITGAVNDSDVFIANSLGEWFGVGYEKLSADQQQFSSAQAGETYELHTREYGELTVARISSGVVDAEIVSMVSTDVYHQKSAEIRRIMRVYVVICLLLGSGFAFLFTHINYNPLKRIRKILASHNRAAETKTIEYQMNEYQLLENTLTTLLSQETELKKLMLEKNQHEQNALLTQMLLGRVLYDGKAAAMMQRRFMHDHFAAVLIEITPMEAGNNLSLLAEQKTVSDIMLKAIGELGESIFSDYYYVSAAEVYGELVFILNGECCAYDVFSSRMEECMARLTGPVQASFSVHVCVDVSSIHEGRSALADAFTETQLVREYRRYTNDIAQLLTYDMISSQLADEELRMVSLKQQRLFLNCLESSNYEGAEKILAMILNGNMGTYRAARLQRAQIISCVGIMVNHVLSQQDASENGNLSQLEKLYDEVLNENTSTGLRKKTEQLYQCAVRELQSSEQEKVPLCVIQAEQYADMCFTDSALSVSAIADQLNLSTSYLSRTYKKVRGIGLLDYIHRKRLDMAKTYIHTMSVVAIAEKTGYTDSKALINAFKRYEGTTPGRFRESDTQF